MPNVTPNGVCSVVFFIIIFFSFFLRGYCDSTVSTSPCSRYSANEIPKVTEITPISHHLARKIFRRAFRSSIVALLRESSYCSEKETFLQRTIVKIHEEFSQTDSPTARPVSSSLSIKDSRWTRSTPVRLPGHAWDSPIAVEF